MQIRATNLYEALFATGCLDMLHGLSFVVEGTGGQSTFRPTPGMMVCHVTGYVARRDKTAFIAALDVAQGLYCVEIRMVNLDDKDDDDQPTKLLNPMTGYRRVQFDYFKQKFSDPDWVGELDTDRVEMRTIMNTGRIVLAAGNTVAESDLPILAPFVAVPSHINGVWDKPKPFGEEAQWKQGAEAFPLNASRPAVFTWKAFLRRTSSDPEDSQGSTTTYYDLWVSEDWPYLAQYKACRIDVKDNIKKGVEGAFARSAVCNQPVTIPKALQWFENATDHNDELSIYPRSTGVIFATLMRDVTKNLLGDRQFLACKNSPSRGVAVLSRKRKDTKLFINMLNPANSGSTLENSWEGAKGCGLTYADMFLDNKGGPLSWLVEGDMKAFTIDEMKIRGAMEVVE